MNKSDIKKLYTEKHLTMAQIGKKYNLSRERVRQILKSEGVKSTDGTWFTSFCNYCGKGIAVRRYRKKQKVFYCNRECFRDKRLNKTFTADPACDFIAI